MGCLSSQAVTLNNAVQTAFCSRRGNELVNNEEEALDWPNTDYTQRKKQPTEPSRKFTRLFVCVNELRGRITS